MNMDRRTFIESTAAAIAGLSLGGITAAFKQGDMPRRLLGKTGLEVSLISIGGHTFARSGITEKESLAIVRTGIDEGINFLDNAWCYNGGRSEKRMGKALMNGYRDKVVLMTKHHGRDPQTARQHLEESLRRLKTEVIDVWQFHEIMTLNDVEKIYTSGVLDFVQQMKEEGKIRFIGFTGHAHPNVHLAMINKGFAWDTIQMPVNVLDYHYLSFSNQVVPVATDKNIGIIGMKSLAGGPIARRNIAGVEESMHFSMTYPISTLCSGIDTVDILHENIQIARHFDPMDEATIASLLDRTLPYSKEGMNEWYKKTVY